MVIDKSILGITGEYYVAAELGKRNVYAQLTLGNQKRADLLIFSEDSDKIIKLEVKNKQGSTWPNCKGIFQKGTFIIFVDFKRIGETQRPQFYILSVDEWTELVKRKEKEYKKKNPTKRTIIKNNVLIFLDQVNKQGNPYMGIGISQNDIEEYKEKWDSILNELKMPITNNESS